MSGAHDDRPGEGGPINPSAAARITWDISISTVLLLLGALATGMYVIAQTRSQAEQAQHDISDLKTELRVGLTDIKHTINVLPDQTARVTELERRTAEADQWRATTSNRLNHMRDDISLLQAQVATIEQASQTGTLPSPRPSRASPR